MDLLPILNRYQDDFLKKYSHRLSPEQKHALYAMQHCRSERYGEMTLQCNNCQHQQSNFHSCGNRSCPRCQHHDNAQWLERQKQKLLPVTYFMVTFTLPFEFRQLVFENQKVLYAALIKVATSTLKTFAKNDPNFSSDIGMTLILHTHTRDLTFHPHVHIIIPGGSLNKRRRQWRSLHEQYLFNEFALANVFRARFLAAVQENNLKLPPRYPKKWVAHCKKVGKGLPALTYLARYLYRGVISENNILSDDGSHVTFQYKESKTNIYKHRKLKGADFLWLLLQHVLPKGFRRVRDFGFLHGNAKRILRVIQWVLGVITPPYSKPQRASFKCARCQHPMTITGFKPYIWRNG